MEPTNSLWHLENVDVSGIFCPQKVADGGLDSQTHRNFKRGEYIFLPDEDADKVYFVFEGRVKIGTYGEDGKEITKTILGPGEVFGELSIISENQEKRRDFAFAMEKTTTCVLTMKQIKSLMREYNGFSLFLMKIMGRRVLQMEKRLESLVFKDSRTRIIEFLFNLATEKGQRVGYEVVVRKFITHQEIANLTATSRQTVTTILNELRNDNVLTFDRKRLLVRDMDLLKKEMDI
ncbi:MAG: Crp/Fnr family transcriptional regulator [Lewinella sp.]|uniref:Crp/Fnr family transcriptional regulator n=1 Tax=Lewinella sp. TaxID=2004506 RepID=UPI003D6C13C9